MVDNNLYAALRLKDSNNVTKVAITTAGNIILSGLVDSVDVSEEPARISTEIDSDITTHAGIATAHQDAPALIATHATNANAHHAQSHTLASHSDVTITGPQIDDAVMLGGNTAWVNCVYIANNAAEAWTANTSTIANPSTTNQWLLWHLPLPTTKGTLKLHVTGVRVGIAAANATNKISEILVHGVKWDGKTYLTVSDRTTQGSSAGLKEWVMANFDCSTYEVVTVDLSLALATIGAFRISSVALLCYYA